MVAVASIVSADAVEGAWCKVVECAGADGRVNMQERNPLVPVVRHVARVMVVVRLLRQRSRRAGQQDSRQHFAASCNMRAASARSVASVGRGRVYAAAAGGVIVFAVVNSLLSQGC